MCGRYAATANPDELVEEMEVEQDRTAERTRSLLATPQDPPPGEPDYNMAPTKQAPVVLTRVPKPAAGTGADAASGAGSPEASGRHTDEPMRQLRMLSWGLVPSWAKDTKIGLRMINARAESLLDKGAFAKAAAARRCLVPARGWYEWQASPVATDAKGKPRKQPFFVTRADADVLAMAGIYEFWRDPDRPDDDPDAWLVSYAVITTAAEEGLDRIHDRQPLILDREHWAEWLDPRQTDPTVVLDHLEGRPGGRFEAWPISTAVNGVRRNGPELVEPLGREQLAGVVDPGTGEIIGAPS